MPHSKSLYERAKRAFDIAASAAGLVVISPALGAIALLIKFGSPGPVFYRGVRIGLKGRPFRIYKFRTMVVDAEKLGGSATANDDARITRIGRLLRGRKLDELPQLLNVFKGEMSFVGPRPEVRKYTDLYNEEEQAILDVPPGITDWASIWDSDEGAILEGAADPEKAYEELIRPTKLALQLYYVRNRSLAADFRILFHTMLRLLNGNWVPKEIATCQRPGHVTGPGVQREASALGAHGS